MAINDLYIPENAFIYPGKYEPMQSMEQLLTELSKKAETRIIRTPVNISEQSDHYRIEAILPGLRREELFLFAREGTLTIIGMYKRVPAGKDEDYRVHEFNYDYVRQEIALPGNADADLVTARFEDGILTMWILKSPHPSCTKTTTIVVY